VWLGYVATREWRHGTELLRERLAAEVLALADAALSRDMKGAWTSLIVPVNQTAIETSLRGRLQLVVRKDMRLGWPRGETPTHWIAMGMDKDLTRATQIAVQEAIDFIAAYRSWPKMEAYRLVSIACDVRITELVDGNVGVHVMIPKSIVGKR